MHRACALYSPLTRLCAALYLSVIVTSAAAQQPTVRLDSSDWWSYTREEEFPHHELQTPIHFQHREPSQKNFQLDGINLDSLGQDFSAVQLKFGACTEVERGDAASGRNQICYTSAAGSEYLIFEFGEINSAFYLFDNGRKWSGSELCARSEAVSAKSSTASGLRLGMSRQEVKHILGFPSIDRPNKLVYYFSYKKKTDPKVLELLRTSNPNMSDAEFQGNFESADDEVYIEVRFGSEKVNYLAISKSETY